MAGSGAANIGMDNPNAEAHQTQSILETDDLTDFLARAKLADREFESEKEQFVVLDANAQQVVFDSNNDTDNDAAGNGSGNTDQFDFSELSIPKRPKWDESTTPEQLDRSEKETFLIWRRAIARHEEAIAARTVHTASRTVTATPFEKNLEVWRQLWRVLERSDCVAMVVDGRNPLFYISMDLRRHVEDELGKAVVVIVNKCDYLTAVQRRRWHEYFTELGLEHIFFSAVVEQEILDRGVGIIKEETKEEIKETYDDDDHDDDSDSADDSADDSQGEQSEESKTNEEAQDKPQVKAQEEESKTAHHDPPTQDNSKETTSTTGKTLLDPNSIGIETPLTRSQLLQILSDYTHLHLKTSTTSPNTPPPHIELGMVGFPNVGKSSVLNVLVGASRRDHATHRVGVASQPGKTRHFQTLDVPDRPDLTLCDCPGLVFPSFVADAADLVVAGVVPLSRVKDCWPGIRLVTRRVPRVVLEAYYGIELPGGSRLDGMVGDVGGRETTAEELLTAYCRARSLVAAASGAPDFHRAGKTVLGDYVTGKLLFCHAPPALERGGEGAFRRETLLTALTRASKLRVKLGAVFEMGGDGDAPSPEDDDMLDFIEDDYNYDKRETGGNRGKKHKSMQKWGKKGRKNRNKDPYGCHVEPDEELLGSNGRAGLCVNAGKYGSSAYTRPNYAGAKGAVTFAEPKKVAR